MKLGKFYKNFRKEIILTSIFFLLSVFAFVFYSNVHILQFKKKIKQPEEINSHLMKNRLTLVIFGGGMKSKDKMTRHQRDRVIKGVQIYKGNSKMKQILITGDDGKRRANEVEAMKELALKMGIKREDILVDPHGYGTYESCHRAKNIFGVKKIAAVSQRFHLPRIIYTCSNMGINTIGISANISEYDDVWTSNIREALARAKALWQVEFTRPHPSNMVEVMFGF